nr:DUF3108 domain-containing protein [Bacteroidota bacterium]
MESISKYILLLCFSLICVVVPAQEFEYRTVGNDVFVPGEKLKYRVYYESLLTGKVDAGVATLEIKNSNRRFNNREVYHVIGSGKSNRAFDLFFKVRDRFESYIDKEALAPHLFIRRTKEGGYVMEDDIYFDHENGIAKSSRTTKNITPYMQDIISASLYARTFDFSDVKEGDNFPVDFYLDDSAYISVIQFQGIETVETSLGIFTCLAFKPMVATGEVFSNPYPMTLWVTNDKNKLPVLAKSAVIVGSVKMELINYSGLAHPVEARIGD